MIGIICKTSGDSMARVFISYRRKSWPFTQRLADELAKRLDAEIFVDYASIDQADFETSILGHLRASDAVLLVISETTFGDRIQRDDDWVRREIREALERNIPIVLVCIDGLLPPPGLPEDIRAVARMQGINFYPEFFTPAVDRLAAFVVKIGAAPFKQEIAAPAPQPDERSIGGKPSFDAALDLLDQGDYGKALFLLEQLRDGGYRANMAGTLDTLMQQARENQARLERRRQAELIYADIAALAARKFTQEMARAAFQEWAAEYPDLVSELDSQRLAEHLAPGTPPALSRRLPLRLAALAALIVVAAAAAALVVTNNSRSAQPSPTDRPSLTPTKTDEPTLTAVPTLSPEQLALTPVSANAAWTPVERDFDGVTMVLVPAGCFDMGSTDEQIDYAVNELGAQRDWFDDEQPVQQVCFDAPFWIDQTEVTQADFERLGGVKANENAFDDDLRPVERITWFEARNFCTQRGMRLPNEAEWEYAARGPDNLIYPWGNAWNENNAVWSGNSGGQTAAVGSRLAGASWVGALDMSGNVWEWVSSLYQPYPYDAADGREDDTGNRTDVSRVLRGGSWGSSLTNDLRAANRYRANPGDRSYYNGFRCALS